MMHTISRLLSLLFLAPYILTQLFCMEEKNCIIICNTIIPQEICTHIIHDLFSKNEFNTSYDTLKNMSLTNKNFYSYMNTPQTTRTILNIISEGKYQNVFAKSLNTLAAKKYILKNTILYRNIYRVGVKRIKKLLRQGADINYWPEPKPIGQNQNQNKRESDNRSLLIKALNSFHATKNLLLLGGDSNSISPINQTPLEILLKKNKPSTAQLFISNNLANPLLPLIVSHGNTEIINTVLTNDILLKKVPVEDFRISISIASEQGNKKLEKQLTSKLNEQLLLLQPHQTD